MTEYHKIDSVYLRDPANRNRTFLLGEWAREEFGLLSGITWEWSEKADGTNIRVIAGDDGKIRYRGKTDAAQIPQVLVAVLQDHFDAREIAPGTVLYGEGYGPGINGNPHGLDVPKFVMFDALLPSDEGPLVASRDTVVKIAATLDCDVVPVVGRGTLQGAIAFAADGFGSSFGGKAEGLVMRPRVELRDRRGRRIITKVKTKDFAP